MADIFKGSCLFKNLCFNSAFSENDISRTVRYKLCELILHCFCRKAVQHAVFIFYLYLGKVLFKKCIRLHTDKLAEAVCNAVFVRPELFVEAG